MLARLLAVLCAALPLALSQSNYASQGNSIEYQPGLPPSTILNGKVTKLDDISSMIFLNRTKAYLNCSQGSMQVELKFEEPFYGVAYADFDRNSACIFKGRGSPSAKLELPLKGCGTRQDPQRVFTNNVVVRFHPGLEMDGDEVITIVCRYPPPVAPAPPKPPESILATETASPLPEPPLKGFQILLIICAILFLSLLLMGLGCSYMCLKRRNVRVIHRHPFGSGSGSEITKLSASSLSNITMFEGLKIPRAHALLHAPPSTTGSDANLMIDHSLPSDYPSESSEVDEEPSLPVSSAGSYDNKAFAHHESHQLQRQETRTSSSLYSETVAAEVEAGSTTAANASRTIVGRHMVAVPIEPKFDVQMRVKRAPPPPPSPLPSESDAASVTLERNLTTILEKEESSLTRSLESPPARTTTFSYVPELHGPPGGGGVSLSPSTISRQQTPPVYSRILRKQAERETATSLSASPLDERRVSSPQSAIEQPPLQHHEIRRPRSLGSLNTEPTESRSLTEVTDHTHAKYRVASILAPTPPPPPPIAPVTAVATHAAIQHREQHRLYREELAEPLLEPRVVAPRRPEITTHEVDDVFLKTVTEKKTIEDVERHRRQVTEYASRPQSQPPPDPKWDVTIRNYPTENHLPPPPPEWENFSDASSTSNLTIANESNAAIAIAIAGASGPRPLDEEPDVSIEPTYTARAEIPCRPTALAARRSVDETDTEADADADADAETDADWFARLSRVLEPRYAAEFSEGERVRWREIITTDSTLRTLLTEAVVKEDYELIRKDARYTNLFAPAKWDVIIRILGPPSNQAGPGCSSHLGKNHRYKRSKSSEWDTRSRRSSLPTLYEYESDGGSSARTQGHRIQVSQAGSGSCSGMGQPSRPRRLGSSHRGAAASSEADVRSMSEMTVRDFVRVDRDDLTSLSSFEGADSLVRSLSQPSLARSGSEFTEHWGIPSGMMDLPAWAAEDPDDPEDPEEGASSVETTPRLLRRTDRLRVLASVDHDRGQTLLPHSLPVPMQLPMQMRMQMPMPMPAAARSSRYTERELSSVRVTESQRTSNWFHDDSEPEMQI